MGLLDGKVALITGAARGIGKAIALRFAQEGADIAFTDLEINDVAKQTVAELEAFGHKVEAYASNAADFEQTHQVVEDIVKKFGRIDILVNNAGIPRDGLMLRMEEKQWDAVLTVNLKSAFNFIHALTPVMAKQRGGSIINMSSVVGVSGNAGQCNYSASKAGLIGLTKSIAKEMGPRGIRVNLVAPGYIWTERWEHLDEATKARRRLNCPLRAEVKGREVAEAVAFFASPASGNVTGERLVVDGGCTCQHMPEDVDV